MSVPEILASRAWMRSSVPGDGRPLEAEGGCGVVGIASSVPLAGRHILPPLVQMHNRGNGKGGGIAAVGLDPGQMKVSRRVLEEDYLIQVAYLKPEVRKSLESEFISRILRVDARYKVDTSKDKSFLGSLEVRPPEVWRYFCRVRPEVLDEFVKVNELSSVDPRKAEDEFVYQNCFRINHKYYANFEMAAFVMSYGRNMIVLKVVGYAEDVMRYYKLEDLRAYVWIGHQRYPTKGRVWHPGGAHPFVGVDEALVHNGDFANYHSVSEYLSQRGVVPLFLTDTEISVLLFDVWNRLYAYPLEHIIEALAPTNGRDFYMLPDEKKREYRAVQASSMHGSPDGPWFFIIGRNCFYEKKFQLLGITDTSMLRPQVFALVDGEVQMGLIASEKQAIDAALRSVSGELPSVPKQADAYWNARGGSHTDGGAFVFSLFPEEGSKERMRLIITNKFGRAVTAPFSDWSAKDDLALSKPLPKSIGAHDLGDQLLAKKNPTTAFGVLTSSLSSISGTDFNKLLAYIVDKSRDSDASTDEIAELLTMLMDRRYPTGRFRPGRLAEKATDAIERLLRSVPRSPGTGHSLYSFVDSENVGQMHPAPSPYHRLVIDAAGFPMEGEQGVSFAIRNARELGWNRVLVVGLHGQRFVGCGLGPKTKGFRVDVYGSSGDYSASGLDGAEVVVHGNGQDQLGQIMNDGKLVVYGDVGQTFLYGAKGGESYVMGNAAGRPLINAVGRPRVVINGTCLDYLAESFMAGNPLYGGGFVVLNGITFDATGQPVELPTPYPGGNLFSLASGGAIYVRDPRKQVGEDQLNGGRIAKMTEADWRLIEPYLRENERLFGISVDQFLLKVDGVAKHPEEVYRKIEAVPLVTLSGKTQFQDTGS